MTNPSSNGESEKENRIRLFKAIWIFVVIASLVFILLLLQVFQVDPYVKATLDLQGSMVKGEKLFRINCVGCHGISAQGLLGPDLHDVNDHLSKKEKINQVRQGKTPPMPSFQMEPQQMADLLIYLKSLD